MLKGAKMNAGEAPTPGIALHYLAGPGVTDSVVPLVLLHGWGSDSRCWQPIAERLGPELDIIAVDLPGFGAAPPAGFDLDTLIEQLVTRLPPRFALAGWSLGGMIATALAARHPRRVERLVTLAANASFIRRPGWTTAMPEATFADFCRGFETDPARAHKQFCGLQARGDERQREVMRWLRDRADGNINGDWHLALSLLGGLDNRHALADLKMPALHVFGDQDALVPVSAARAVSTLNSSARVKVLPGVGHVPQASVPGQLGDTLLAFIDGHRIDKQRVARSFSRAAATYDSAARLQRRVGDELLVALAEEAPPDWRPRVVADIGCGTGRFTRALKSRYPSATCAGIDLAKGMVVYAGHHARERGDEGIHWLCGDAEQLPLEDGSLDLAYSNFTFQWCQQPAPLMAELCRVLRPGGMLVFSSLGPASLAELRQAWQAVDCYTHVNRFGEVPVLRSALDRVGFNVHRFDSEQRVEYHRELRDLTWELKNLGAHNANRGRNGGLTGRRQVAAFRAAYEALRTPEGLPATWETIRVVAVKP